MSDENNVVSVENLVDDGLINEDFFLSLLNAVNEKKRILLIGQPGAHGLTTLAAALIVQGDTQGINYEIFDADVLKDRKNHNGKQYFAHLRTDEDKYALLSAWANGAAGIATIYADSIREAMDSLGTALKDKGIADPNAFVNFTVDILCMIENENDTDSVVRDVIIQHR